MENVTIGQIAVSMALLVSFITATTVISNTIKKTIEKLLKPIHTKIDNLDLGQARNYLVDFLSDIENGVEKDECQIERAYELYDHYTNDLGGNSYIHNKWERVMKDREKKRR